jgi:hypothetical protein
MKVKSTLCSRCKKIDSMEGKSRCNSCLDYARNWQKNKTRERREKQLCITCGTQTNGPSRCTRCTENKNVSYLYKSLTDVAV